MGVVQVSRRAHFALAAVVIANLTGCAFRPLDALSRAFRGPLPIDERPIIDHSQLFPPLQSEPETNAQLLREPTPSTLFSQPMPSAEKPRYSLTPDRLTPPVETQRATPPPLASLPEPPKPPKTAVFDSGLFTATWYVEWHARMTRVSMAAAQCGLRSFHWAAVIHSGLGPEFSRRIAGARESTSSLPRFEAHFQRLMAWHELASQVHSAHTSPAACNRLEFSEDLKIADYTWARFASRL